MLESLGINLMVVPVQVVIFTTLVLVLWKFFFARVAGAVVQREHQIQGILHDIESKQKAVEQSMQDYTRRMKEIEQEATLKIQDAVKEGQRVKAEIESQAKAKADAALAQGKAQIQREKDLALADLQKQASKLAEQAAERILSEPMRWTS